MPVALQKRRHRLTQAKAHGAGWGLATPLQAQAAPGPVASAPGCEEGGTWTRRPVHSGSFGAPPSLVLTGVTLLGDPWGSQAAGSEALKTAAGLGFCCSLHLPETQIQVSSA